ncbi:hypothetical protein ABZ816_27055 [Actinosynnema sp. NPDC047251]|uniref:Uncharacterized protein n=1 Tax=Saccharothrix espanaensis (strain ATCC 51144 / DSM 44229 / JCM 9112 / NBRC 15066 / NRRL 15764) TaxID=1179773 RepID=K0K0Q6_SACES|nr:hypothetical protein [Saccharothrix espanaensis]CCH31946.1 hypothetical protein BN6_46670 [Saccharothrix espanaensis DSM 44229]
MEGTDDEVVGESTTYVPESPGTRHTATTPAAPLQLGEGIVEGAQVAHEVSWKSGALAVRSMRTTLRTRWIWLRTVVSRHPSCAAISWADSRCGPRG